MIKRSGRTLEVLEMRRYTGTVTSNPEFNAALGSADEVIVHAVVDDSSGASPTLTVTAEDSADGENWASLTDVIASTGLSGAGVYRGSVATPFGRYLRLGITIGGTAPEAIMALRVSLKNN